MKADRDHDPPPIEKGIPLPPQKMLGRKTAWLGQMEIGDSFFLADARSADDGRIMNARAWAKRQRPPRHFVSRQEIGGGVRVWRDK